MVKELIHNLVVSDMFLQIEQLYQTQRNITLNMMFSESMSNQYVLVKIVLMLNIEVSL
jgi:hypothetical protein